MSKEQANILSERLLTAEQGVLGAMLIDENAVGPMLMRVTEEDFQRPEYRNVFRAFREIYGQGRAPDPILINEHLGGHYDKLLVQLMEITPTSANADAYAQSLRETSRLWRLQQIGDQLSQADSAETCRELIDKANMILCERSGVRRLNMAQGLKEFFVRYDPKNHKECLK